MLRKVLKEKSDSLNINQMDVFFVDLCSFMSVSETLYSRKRRIAICYRRNQNQTTVERLLLVIILKINGRSREALFVTGHCLYNHMTFSNCRIIADSY